MNHCQLLTIAKFSVWEAVRDKFLMFIIIGMLVFLLISVFVGELAITEGTMTQAAILAATLRFFAVFTIGLFVITSMIREFNDKGFELILSHPVTRSSYYFGKFFGFSFVALIIILMCLGSLCLYVPVSLAFLWSFSLYCELLIIISLSLLCVFSFNSITISFSIVMGFYILSRTIEAIQLISDSSIINVGTVSHKLMNGLLDVIAYLVPNLGDFTNTEWLIYQSDSEFSLVVGQTIIYVILLSCVSLFDLYRKEL